MSSRYLALDELAHDLVVEKVDGSPCDTLGAVLFLLRFERELDEDLLELFVDIVDAELLKAVFLSWELPLAPPIRLVRSLPQRSQSRKCRAHQGRPRRLS